MAEENIAPERLAGIFPASAKVTKERWEEICKADQEHAVSRPDHEISTESGIVFGKPAKRPQCECGWKGEWRR